MRILQFTLLVSPLLTAGCLYDYSTLRGSSLGDASIIIPDASGSGGTPAPGSGGDNSPADAGPPIITSTGGNSGVGEGGIGGRMTSAGGDGGGGRSSGSGGGGRGGGGPGGSAGRAVGSGGAGAGGKASGSGGAGTGGFIGTGGAGTGGVFGTGGAGTGGVPGTGGRGTGGAAAGVRILSIDFVGGTLPALLAGGAGGAAATDPVVSLPVMGPGEVAGFKRATHWNGAVSLAGSLSGLVLGDGTMTPALVTWYSPPSATRRGVWWVGFPDVAGDVRMMNGYLDPHSADVPEMPATITVAGLPTAITTGGYDVYVYTYGELASGTRTYGYSIGATSFTVTQTSPTASTFAGYQLATPGGAGNYIVFRNLTDPFFTLTATPGTGQGPRAPVNGIQIVSPSGS